MEFSNNFFILLSLFGIGSICFGLYICCKKKYNRPNLAQIMIPENQYEYSIINNNFIHQNPLPPPYKEIDDDVISLPPPYQN
jgi:hypothetical protein